MPGYIYASSYGDLGQLNQTAEAQRQHNMQQAIGNVMQGLAATRQSKQFDEQMQAESDRQRTAEDWRNREQDLRTQEFIDKKAEGAERNALAKRYATLAENQFNWQKTQPTSQQLRESDLSYNRALGMAQLGQFDPADHPSLTHEEARSIGDINEANRASIEANHAVASNAADTLNQHEIAKRYVPIVEKAIKEGSHIYVPQSLESGEMKYYRSQLGDWTDHLNQLGQKASRILGDKRISAMVTYDPDQDAYVPAVPEPKWRKQGQAPTISPDSRPEMPTPNPTSGTSVASDARAARPQLSQWDEDYAAQGGAPSSPRVPVDEGPAPMITTTGTSGYRPKYPPMVYERVNYWMGKGMDAVSAKQRALAEVQAVQ
jgi:hypothetical protein